MRKEKRQKMDGSASRDMSLTERVVHNGEIRAMAHYTTTIGQVAAIMAEYDVDGIAIQGHNG